MNGGDEAGFLEACKTGDEDKVRAMLDENPALAHCRDHAPFSSPAFQPP